MKGAAPKAILFDLDGTLIEFHREYLFSETHRIVELLEHPPVTPETLEECFALFDYFQFVAEESRETFPTQFWGHFNWEGFPAPKAIAGVSTLLEQLAGRGIQSAIVTARAMHEEALRTALSEAEFLPYIHSLHTRPGEHVHWKDKREMIFTACRALGVKPEECWMIGDIPPDIECAKDVGVGKTFAVLSGGIRREILEQAEPDAILSDVCALVDIIDGRETAPA